MRNKDNIYVLKFIIYYKIYKRDDRFIGSYTIDNINSISMANKKKKEYRNF